MEGVVMVAPKNLVRKPVVQFQVVMVCGIIKKDFICNIIDIFQDLNHLSRMVETTASDLKPVGFNSD